MTETTAELVARALALSEKATGASIDDIAMECAVISPVLKRDNAVFLGDHTRRHINTVLDKHFKEARALVPELASALTALEAENKRLRGVVEAARETLAEAHEIHDNNSAPRKYGAPYGGLVKIAKALATLDQKEPT